MMKMPGSFRLVMNKTVPGGKTCEKVSGEAMKKVSEFHSGIGGYCVTPLVSLNSLAKKCGAEKIYVKNESKRFGLNAFKGLGGSYAIAACLCEKFGVPLDKNTFSVLTSAEFHEKIKDITFITATDGNHGRGVAWFASRLGCRAVVYLPKGTAAERLNNILALGAHAEITEFNYDDTVRLAEKTARENGWVLVQDTSWNGYEDIPLNVMRGYTTLGAEIIAQLEKSGEKKPTHLFLQAGVGSMAAAVAGYFAAEWRDECPKIIVVEPDKADCLFRTAEAADGKLHFVSGDMNSMMAGLCCGEPCPLAWDILKETACGFISCDDSYSAFGMKMLASPETGDEAIVSGESGAVTAGAAVRLLTDPALAAEKEALGLNESSRILVISTEGDTDRENYLRIIGG